MRRVFALLAVVAVFALSAAPAAGADVAKYSQELDTFYATYHDGPTDAAGNWLPGLHTWGSASFQEIVWLTDGVVTQIVTSADVNDAQGTIDADGAIHLIYARGGSEPVASWTFGDDLSGGSVTTSVTASGCIYVGDQCATPIVGTYTIALVFTGTGHVRTDAGGYSAGTPGVDRTAGAYRNRSREATVTGTYLYDGAPVLPWSQVGLWTQVGHSNQIIN